MSKITSTADRLTTVGGKTVGLNLAGSVMHDLIRMSLLLQFVVSAAKIGTLGGPVRDTTCLR